MARARWIGWVGAAALAFACSGCGGETGGGGTPQPTGGGATPTPGPTPTPAPAPVGVRDFGSLGQTTPQTFASYGFSYRATDNGFGYDLVEGSVDPTFTPSLRLAAQGQLFLTVSGFGEGWLRPDGSSGTSPVIGITEFGYYAPGGRAYISVIFKTLPNTVLANSASASWVSDYDSATPSAPYLISPFVYGVPTPPAAIPASGIATYAAPNISTGERSIDLTLDFSARTVTGSVVLASPTGPVSFMLQGVTFTGDGSQFSGNLVVPGNAIQGTFEGRFTGPSGEELIGRYTVPRGGGVEAGLWAAYRN